MMEIDDIFDRCLADVELFKKKHPEYYVETRRTRTGHLYIKMRPAVGPGWTIGSFFDINNAVHMDKYYSTAIKSELAYLAGRVEEKKGDSRWGSLQAELLENRGAV